MVSGDFSLEDFVEGGISFSAPRTLLTTQTKNYHPIHEPVFYNSRMELNRDATIAVLVHHAKENPLNSPLCDAFSGCGVRAIRFALQVPSSTPIIANDINPLATSVIAQNVTRLHLEKRIDVKQYAAEYLWAQNINQHKSFSFIDIDPFGSPVRFLDSAIASLEKKLGLLGVTATDMPVLCGIYPKACLRKYGSYPMKTEYVHEVALRILIYSIILAAGRQNRGFSISLAYSADHYVRVIGTLSYGGSRAHNMLENIGFISHCPLCNYRTTFQMNTFVDRTEVCPQCQGSVKLIGPLFIGQIFKHKRLEQILAQCSELELGQKKKLEKILNTQLGEAGGPATFYDLHKIKAIRKKNQQPIKQVIDLLVEQGYFASRTHFSPTGIRTNATMQQLINVIGEL